MGAVMVRLCPKRLTDLLYGHIIRAQFNQDPSEREAAFRVIGVKRKPFSNGLERPLQLAFCSQADCERKMRHWILREDKDGGTEFGLDRLISAFVVQRVRQQDGKVQPIRLQA